MGESQNDLKCYQISRSCHLSSINVSQMESKYTMLYDTLEKQGKVLTTQESCKS